MENLPIIFTVLGVVLSISLSCAGSAMGVGLVGQATSGVLTEDPKKFGKSLALQLLPGTQGIYGTIVAFLILLFSGLMGGNLANITLNKGFVFFGSGAIMGATGLWSAIHQGRCVVANVHLFAKRENQYGKSLLIGAMVEFYAILGLLISILLLIYNK